MYICKQYYKSVIISRDFQPKKGGRCFAQLHTDRKTAKSRSSFAPNCFH